MDLLIPDTGTIFWTLLTFIILFWVLKKLAWKPILDTLAERETTIQRALQQAAEDQISAARLLEEQKALLDAARKESTRIIDESLENAEKFRKESLEQARQEADKLLNRARQEIELSRDAAIAEIRTYAIDLSLTATQKFISDNLSPEQHLRILERQLNELSHPE